ncbi:MULTISPECIES: hypothetical protein [Olivibacter]|uniref:Uncharacterized protein n=1 Tax=Olivibacter jilunii TaxID=985016 RepID=A0ABW6AZU9_9SPHI
MKVIRNDQVLNDPDANEVDLFIQQFAIWHNKRIKRIKDKRPELVRFVPGKTEVIMRNKRSSGAR